MRVVALLSFAAFLIALTVTAAITHRHSGGTWAFDAAFDHHSVLSLLCGDTPMSLCAQALTSSKATGGMHLIRRQVTKRALHLVADGVRHADHLQGAAAVPAAVQRYFARVQSEVAPDASDMDIALAFSKLRKQGVLREMSGDSLAAEQYPYFGFLPRTVGSSPPGAAAFNEPTECFTNVSMSTAWNADSTVLTATLTTAGQTSFLCTDTYAIGLYGVGFKLVSVATEGTITHDFKVDLASRPAAQQWYINNRGLRLFKFNKSVLGLIGDIIDTVILLAGFFMSPVPNATMEANYVFLRDYVEISPRMQPMSQVRTAGMTVVNELNESYIQSGDGLVVVRYDGLDPIIGWGEGFTGGHSTIAIREPTTGILHVCESTAHDGYWTTNGIQCTPWRQWFALAQKADYNVLLAPLTPANAAKFNATAAWAFFNETAGLNYGYLNFLFGWIDVKNGNFPCLPTQYTYCLNEQVVEIVAVLWDELQPTNPENVFRQALNHRVGTWNYSVMEVMQYGFEQYNWTFPDIYIRPELDSWRYNTTRYGAPAVGRSMVCCVFVCHMWKEGGLFDGIGRNINCGDQTLWDIFSMQMFDPTKLNDGRPEVCKKNDPNNELCQLIGGHTFYAKPDFNTRALYPWMGQKCSSLSPDYVREAGC